MTIFHRRKQPHPSVPVPSTMQTPAGAYAAAHGPIRSVESLRAAIEAEPDLSQHATTLRMQGLTGSYRQCCPRTGYARVAAWSADCRAAGSALLFDLSPSPFRSFGPQSQSRSSPGPRPGTPVPVQLSGHQTGQSSVLSWDCVWLGDVIYDARAQAISTALLVVLSALSGTAKRSSSYFYLLTHAYTRPLPHTEPMKEPH